MSRSSRSSKGPFASLRRWWRKRRSRQSFPVQPSRKRNSRFYRSWRSLTKPFRKRPDSSLRSLATGTKNNKRKRSQLARLSRRFRLSFLNLFRFQKPMPVSGQLPKRKLQWQHFLNPIHWLIWPFGFFLSYITSRPYLSLVPGLFAIAVMIGLLTLVVQQRYQGDTDSRSQLYQRLLIQEVKAKDYHRALICCKTLIDLSPKDLRYQFEKAKLEKELGNTDAAYEQMLRLASQRKYGMAAIWVVDEKLNLEKIAEWPKEDHELFLGLMNIAVNYSNGAVLDAAKLKLASYLSALNANNEALKYLTDIVPRNPQFALPAAELALKANDQISLQNLIPVAKNYYQEKLRATPNNTALRLQMGRVLILDQEFDAAIQCIEDGYRLSPSPELQGALGEALVLKGGQIARGKQTPEAVIARMQLIYRAVEIAPNNPLVVEAVVDLMIQFRDNHNRETEVLREAALQGLNPEAVHFVRGTIALLDQRFAEAKSHLDLAAKSGTQLPGLLNNLAVAIAADEKGDLTQALSLVDAAIEQFQHPYFFETRGQILLKLERYKDCIIDLEKGLRSPELAPGIYRSLIIAHSKLGNSELKKEFEDRLAALEASKPKTEESQAPPSEDK